MKKYIGLLGSGAALCLACVLLLFAANFVPALAGAQGAYEQELFHPEKILTIEISMEEADWQDMLENPLQEEYHNANVTIDGVSLANVGIRTKGNNSLTSVAGTDSDRYSFKLDFDHYVDKQNLYGLTKLNLNNNYSDSSSMREALSYQLMEEMGIPTPQYAYANIYINGDLWGLYLAVEGIDETFLANNFDDASGDLYKPDGTGSDLVWIDNNIASYSGLQLKTNAQSSDPSAMLHFLDVINNHPEALEEVADTDEMLRYFAANTALANMDSYQGQMKHNYYLYEQDGVFSIIPWDYNMAFGGFGGGTLLIDSPVEGVSLEERPLLAALLKQESYKETYYAYLREIAEGFLSRERLTVTVGEIACVISASVQADPTAFYTAEEFMDSISTQSSSQQNIIAIGSGLAESILSQLDGGEATYTISGGIGGRPDGGKMGDSQPADGDSFTPSEDFGEGRFPSSVMPNEEVPNGNADPGPSQDQEPADGTQGSAQQPPQLPEGSDAAAFDSKQQENGNLRQPPGSPNHEANGEEKQQMPSAGGAQNGNPPQGGPDNADPGQFPQGRNTPLHWAAILPILGVGATLLACGLTFAAFFRRRKK